VASTSSEQVSKGSSAQCNLQFARAGHNDDPCMSVNGLLQTVMGLSTKARCSKSRSVSPSRLLREHLRNLTLQMLAQVNVRKQQLATGKQEVQDDQNFVGSCPNLVNDVAALSEVIA